MAVGNPVGKFLQGQQFREDLQGRQVNRQINEFNLQAAQEDRVAQQKAAKVAQEAQQRGQAAIQNLVNNPSPTTKDYLEVWASNPAIRDELMQLRTMQTADQNQARVTKNLNLYAAAKSGNIGVLKRLLEEETEAARNSGDDQTVATNEAGMELLDSNPEEALKTVIAQTGLMLIGLKDPKFLEEVNAAIGAETPEQTEAFQTLNARAEAAGLDSGSEEYKEFMLNNGKASPSGFRLATSKEAAQFGAAAGQFGPDGRFYPTQALQDAGFRQATSEEAAAYGATAGQFGPDGRFYPVNPPSGFSLKTNPDGTFSLSQGANAAKPLNESQSKSLTYATRARGALDDFERVSETLTSRGDKLLELIPLGLGREYQDPLYQQAQVAGTEFLQAILRKDTGAAITESENEQYGRVYLPQPGDSPEVLATKKAARKRALVALEAGMTPDAMIALEVASGTAKNFSTMTIDQIRAIDPDTLTEAEAEQALKRLEELGG